MAEETPPSPPLPTVLVVDDERLWTETIRISLEKDFEIETAPSAEEAEVMMASKSYDAVVSDHMLPGEQGLDFLIRMKKLFPRTRRILLTGYMNPEFISRSISLAGLSECLVKPAKAASIANAVRLALERNSQF